MLASGWRAGSVVDRFRYAARKSCAEVAGRGVVVWIVVGGWVVIFFSFLSFG